MASAAVAADQVEAGVEVEDRNQAIIALMNVVGWSSARVGPLFQLSERQARRIAQSARTEEPGSNGRRSGDHLTNAEASSMLLDVRNDPYTSAEEREEIEQWLTSHVVENGIQLYRPAIKGTSGRRPVLNGFGLYQLNDHPSVR